ncbi:MAG: carboxypeptidase-like regulatory domain-containing protein, partial [Terracidiphilus sp.]
MQARVWTKPLARAALLIISGAGTLCCVHAQAPPESGSLAGQLTDIHSSPIENTVVTLRNEATGIELRTTTAHGGRYHFSGLPEGDYTLTASSPLGAGQVDGIFVAAGHEARIQTAMDFQMQRQDAAARDDSLAGTTEVDHLLLLRLRALQTTQYPDVSPTELIANAGQIPLLAEPFVLLPLRGMKHESTVPPPPSVSSSDHPLVGPAKSSSVAAHNPVVTDLQPGESLAVVVSSTTAAPLLNLETQALGSATSAVNMAATQASLLAGRVRPKSQLATIATADSQRSSQSLDTAQLQALPLPGRNWQSFLLDTPIAPSSASDEQRSPARTGMMPEITVEGVSVPLAFGDTSAGRTRNGLMGPGSEDSTIRELQIVEVAGSGAAQSSLGRTNVETQRGTEHLHGQAFVFDRQNLWNAQNPFTQWVQETAPASSTAIPVFTPEPYSAGDREVLWGAGLGGVIHKRRLFWFGALDGYERNDPAVATVKHPDDFFAQPSNDQMQLLSAQLGLNSADPVSAGLGAYSKLLESLAGLLGPAPRSSSQWTGFGRLDWSAGERHRFTAAGTVARLDSPGGGFTRASETYGTHSFGAANATGQWALGRWEAFVTPNILAVTQASYGHQVQSAAAEKPSAFEQSLNINAWGQLPQIVVDSGYGFTIGNPARFGPGTYPDEHLTKAQEQLNWVRGNLMVKAGFEINHNTDATSRLLNQNGTYDYATVEDFASDALAFSAYGISGQLNPMDQHNCDETGKVWRDTSGVLHGLGYLPCYSYYAQTMGPSDWWLSTNDWAGFVTSQWQPTKRAAITMAMRWELEQLPSALAALQNPDLPLTERMPSLGNQWGPRAGFAWGKGESRWPVVRLGYGMYFGRTRNSLVETALTQTGSLNGDLNFFMRPTDNLNAGGAPPFPYVLAGAPASVVKPGAVEFAPGFRNGEIHQAEVDVEETMPGQIHVETSAVASLGRRLPVTFDANIDPAAAKTITYAVVDGNGSGSIKSPQITVPFFASWPSITSPTGFAGRFNPNYQQVSEIFSRANSTYEAAVLRVSRNARALALRARYTYAHAMDWNPDETSQVSGPSVLDPLDFSQEYGTSSLDVRHSATAAVILQPKWNLRNLTGRIGNGWMLSGTSYFRSGLPYTMRTAGSMAKEFDSDGTAIVALSTGMNGYGGDNRVYGVGRNSYRYPAT